MYAVCRSAKHSGSGSLGAASQHATRERETPNADPSRRHLNRVVFGAGDPAAEIERRISELQARGVKIRKNGVRAIELVLSASPEFFSKYPERKEVFYSQSVGWLKSYFGEKNLASVIAHEDESTPHLSVFVLPLDESPRKKGPQIRLNAARWMDGRERLAKMQTSFAQAMAPLGLDRGVEKSRAKHQDVSRFYGIIERAKAITGLDDDLAAIQEVLRNKKKELEHLKLQAKEIERIMNNLQKQTIDANNRIEYARQAYQKEFDSRSLIKGQKAEGILTDVVNNNGCSYVAIVGRDNIERYIQINQKDSEAYRQAKGHNMIVEHRGNSVYINYKQIERPVPKPVQQQPEKPAQERIVKEPVKKGMSL